MKKKEKENIQNSISIGNKFVLTGKTKGVATGVGM